MIIEDQFDIGVSVETAWDRMLDAEFLGGCVPGCSHVEALGENCYRAHMEAKLGPIKTRFKLLIDITELDPPFSLKTIFQGEDSRMASKVRATNTVEFTQTETGTTMIRYYSDVTVVGRLAKFGEGIMRRKAREMGDQFAQTVKLKMEQGRDSTGEVHANTI